jgi:hypothetical protein
MLASLTHKLSARIAAAAIFLALVAAGCGSTTSNSSPAAARPVTSPAQMTQTPAQANTPTAQNQSQAAATAGAPAAQDTPSTAAPAGGSAGIPQGNGGDQDADNNGGPSDGDGNI